MRRLILLCLVLASSACEDRSYRDMGMEIRILTQRSDALVSPAIARLARFGRRALPQIETALHTASTTGKLHLIRALDTIADAEAAPVLRHMAIYEPAAEVREASETLLKKWATAGIDSAHRALARVAEKRAAGEGPVSATGQRPSPPRPTLPTR